MPISIGACQPPKNRIVNIAHISVMFKYSPNIKSKYGVEEYSTIKPATSSDSASGRSNGGRFVSAKAEMKNMTPIKNIIVNKISDIGLEKSSMNICHCQNPPACASTISLKFMEPTRKMTVKIMKPIETS